MPSGTFNSRERNTILVRNFVFRYGADVGRGAQVGNLNEFAVGRNEYFRPGHGEPVHQGEYIVHVSLGELDGIGFGGGDDVVAYVLDGFINVVVVLRVASIACVGFFGEIGSVWGIWSQEHDPCRLAILIELDVWYFKHGLWLLRVMFLGLWNGQPCSNNIKKKGRHSRPRR